MYVEKEIIEEIAKGLSISYSFVEHRQQLSIVIDKSDLLLLAKELRDNPSTSFDMLIDVTAIDWLKPVNRFDVVYFVYSNKNKNRLRIKVPIDENDLNCPSIVAIWESANWYERETYDMYGIIFTGHPFLRRFYMPEDFVDPESGEPLYPLRKDFPLMGIPGSLPLPPYPERDGELK